MVCIIVLFRISFQGAGKDPYFKSNRGDSESEILEQTPDTDDSGPHSCPGEWTTKHSNTTSSNRNITQHKAKKIHKVTNAKESPTSSSNSQKVSNDVRMAQCNTDFAQNSSESEKNSQKTERTRTSLKSMQILCLGGGGQEGAYFGFSAITSQIIHL